MTATLHRLCRRRRYRAALRELRGLSRPELRQLMIPPSEIARLAREVARF